jgi:hypothetical protein
MKSGPAYFGHKVDPERSDIVYLCLDRYIRMDSARDMLLSFDLRSESEVDEAVGRLCEQLASAGKAAKAAMRERKGRPKSKGG